MKLIFNKKLYKIQGKIQKKIIMNKYNQEKVEKIHKQHCKMIKINKLGIFKVKT